jgi:rhodanese-related sulfurtransferase
MLKKIILHDLAALWILLTVSFLGGLILNEMRAKPLELVYVSPQATPGELVSHPGSSAGNDAAPDGDVSRDEMEKLALNRAALIVDARPEIFYRIGHIPSALSLPRDDFDARYPIVQAQLQSQRDRPFVVYCSSDECQDSPMVADRLRRLGYAHVRLYRGGWYDWAGAELPQEKAP